MIFGLQNRYNFFISSSYGEKNEEKLSNFNFFLSNVEGFLS